MTWNTWFRFVIFDNLWWLLVELATHFMSDTAAILKFDDIIEQDLKYLF